MTSTLASISSSGLPARPASLIASHRQNTFARRIAQRTEAVAMERKSDATLYSWSIHLAGSMLTDAAEETVRVTNRCAALAAGDELSGEMVMPFVLEIRDFGIRKFRRSTADW